MRDILDLWLVRLILGLRDDIRAWAEEDPERLLWWLVNAGRNEYASVGESRPLRELLQEREQRSGFTRLQRLVYKQRSDVKHAYPLERGHAEFAHWFYRHGVPEHDLWEWLTHEQWLLASMFSDPPEPTIAPAAVHPTSRPFGVNLVGYAYGQLGIGEDLRMAAKSLHRAGIPLAIVNFPPGQDVGQSDRSVHKWVRTNGPYRYNIFCLTAQEHGRFFAERGATQTAGRYNIGYWPWELEKWPGEWAPMFRLVDEVWSSSRHILSAVSGHSPVPCRLMPMAVDLEPLGRKGRRAFGLPSAAKLFCFAFDLNSSIHRKNAAACMEGFSIAFPASEYGANDVGLVLKCHRPPHTNALWTMIKRKAARDPRIHVIEQTLPRADLLGLYRCCDCFLSLHRAEGFGRNIAEALKLGLHVITTGYSGNVDFCRRPAADLVDYALVPVGPDQYPFSDGAMWAEPDVQDAARLMQRFYTHRRVDRRDRLSPRYRTEAVGEGYLRRLRQIDARLSRTSGLPHSQESLGA